MKKYRLEVILFIVNAIYMILELIASRVLSPYFGNSNLIWTSIIGIILLSTSVGNYIGGIIADKTNGDSKNLNFNIILILIISGILIFGIPLLQSNIIKVIISITKNIKIGAILATLLLFFMPSMFIGMISPIIIKLKMNVLDSVGKTSGKIYALATLGSIIGTFLGGFFLIPNFGSNQILFVLAFIMFVLIFLVDNDEYKSLFDKITVSALVIIAVSLWAFNRNNIVNATKVLNGEINVSTNLDTQYGKVTITNTKVGDNTYRTLNIDKGNESATCIDENKNYDLVYEYTKYYDLMFKSNKEINDVLMIGGAGYSYPKYYISKYADKKMDVVEIDGDITEIAKKFFSLDKLINEYNLNENKRLNFITSDGRVYLNNNTKKYDAILNDAFAGDSPAKTLTTKEAVQRIHDSLNENGVYLSNIISSIDGEKSKFIKAEVKTLREVFKNVYIIPCRSTTDTDLVQNNMVVACDEKVEFDNDVDLSLDNAILLTDNFCPVDSIIPEI